MTAKSKVNQMVTQLLVWQILIRNCLWGMDSTEPDVLGSVYFSGDKCFHLFHELVWLHLLLPVPVI